MSQLVSVTDIAQILSAVGTMIAAIVAVIAAFHSYLSAKQNNETNEQMIRPRIVVYLENAESDIIHIDLVVHNEGGGVARDVTFKIEGDTLPIEFYDSDKKQLIRGSLADFDVLKSGFEVIPAHTARRYFVFDMVGDYTEKMNKKTTVKVEYKNSTRMKTYYDTFRLDLMSLPKMRIVNKEEGARKKIADEAEKIRKVLEKKS